MNTEARVLATLNKIKEVQSKRKDLGAIEDAINEVKNSLQGREETILTIINDFRAKIQKAEQDAVAVAEYLQTELQSAGMDYNEAEADYLAISKELDDMGISYESSLSDLGSNWNELYDQADNLIFNLEN
jgi:hypothetical protein